MTFKPFLVAVALGMALSGTGYACDQVQKDTTNQAANAAYRQFAPPNENQGANSAANYQFEQNRNQGDNQGSNSVVACK
jgi:hypothetical protein